MKNKEKGQVVVEFGIGFLIILGLIVAVALLLSPANPARQQFENISISIPEFDLALIAIPQVSAWTPPTEPIEIKEPISGYELMIEVTPTSAGCDLFGVLSGQHYVVHNNNYPEPCSPEMINNFFVEMVKKLSGQAEGPEWEAFKSIQRVLKVFLGMPVK